MAFSRRNFIGQTIKSAILIGAGNTITSFANNSFALPHAADIKLRFAIASDGHYGQPETRFDEQHGEMIDWLNQEHLSRGLDFTVINGDLFHDDEKFLPAIKAKLDALRMPWHVSHGNHDKTSEENWTGIFSKPWHYSFERGDTGFITLNTASPGGDYICPDIEWTKNALNHFADKKHVFVFMHITPFKWTKGGIDCPEVVELFNKQTNLTAVFHGHDHDMDDVKEANGKYYFFDSHIAGNWGTAYRGYRVVELLHNGNVLTYQLNPSEKTTVNTKALKV
jgi:hypothetical protein